ncbi:MAG: 50S ribosomal protein L11 methyltransferase [Vicinamibacteraceae bacterium]
MKRWPALDIHVGPDVRSDAGADRAGLFAAWLDDHSPTAVTELDAAGEDVLAWRVFFATDEARTIAGQSLASATEWTGATSSPIDVDDEAWAERSQASLTAIRVGRIVVTPPWDRDGAAALAVEADAEAATGGASLVIIIEPSMGFGTGHHESTRLCLAALQRLPLAGRSVVDVGTGSGVLAIAAAQLGAASVVALDDDRDALDSAIGNVALNAVPAGRVEMRVANVMAEALPAADVVLGNLTGALLRRAAATLIAALAPGGTLVVSGFTEDERLAIEHAFSPLAVAAAESEHGWLALTFAAPG